MNGQMITVSQLNRYVKSVLDNDFNLKSVYVTGEISNLKVNSFSGHMYFTLKDENAAVKSVMFKSSAVRLRFIPTEGMKVICRSSVTIYERDGAYQLYVNDMQPDGAGAIAISFEQLKEKLSKEGLFAAEFKKAIPKFPKRIAVVTSETGAAVQDMISILGRRWPLASVLMCPVKVQGDGSAGQMIEALDKVNERDDCDVIIIGRGGGSAEDLWCFNDENLARCIFKSKTPIISAVGHETDFTISDFVADLRAPTPSAAAELAVPDITEITLYVLGLKQRNETFIKNLLNTYTDGVNYLTSKKVLTEPTAFVDKQSIYLDSLKSRLDAVFFKLTSDSAKKIAALTGKLDALNPAKILLRGFSIAEKEGRVLKSVKEVTVGDGISVVLSDGMVESTVTSVERKKTI